MYVKNYIESNNPAFQQIKNNPKEYIDYKKRVNKIINLSTKEKSVDRCNLYLESYFSLIKDNHSGIDMNVKRLPIDLKSQSAIDSFKLTKTYQSFEKLKIDTTSLIAELKSKPINDIEGIYTNGGSLYFGITKTKGNKYKGIILRKTSLVDVGHVLIDIKKIDNTTFDFTLHYGLLAVNFQNIYKKAQFENGTIPEFGFSKTSLELAKDVKPYEFREIDSLTNYLRISSLEVNLKQELNSFYQSIDSMVIAKPYLIIDLRDNGGGSEESYFNLMKYVYTKPFTVDLVEVWVSPDNIRKYENDGHSPELIERMKNATPFTFIPQTLNPVTTWETKGTVNPKKIAILFNRKTASSAEAMILYGMQSDKVITMGENSGGFLGYGNVKNEMTPCGNYIIRCTTTKYKNNSKYEFVGISPQIKLNDSQDWIKAAKVELEKN